MKEFIEQWLGYLPVELRLGFTYALATLAQKNYRQGWNDREQLRNEWEAKAAERAAAREKYNGEW